MKDDRKFSLSNCPLTWPEGWARTPQYSRTTATFSRYGDRLTIQSGLNRVMQQLELMGIRRDDILVSSNVQTRLDGLPRSDQRKPSDPGVAVYWRRKQDAPMQCMAVDIYNEVADNLGAVGATLSALRAIERHGGKQVQERSFLGFAALPAKASSPWRDVLNMSDSAPISRDDIESAFRYLAKKHHPDVGGDADKFQSIVQAREDALREMGVQA